MTTPPSPAPSPPQLLIQDPLVADTIGEHTESEYDSDGSFDHILAFDDLHSPMTDSFVKPNEGAERAKWADEFDFEYLHPIDWDASDGETGKPVLVVEDERGEEEGGLDEQTTGMGEKEEKEEDEMCVGESCEKKEEVERVDTPAFQDLPPLVASDSETDTEPLIYGPFNRPTHTHAPAFFTFLPSKGAYIPRFKPKQESTHLQEPFHLFFPMALENLNLKQVLIYILLPTFLAIYALALNLLPSQKLPTASEWKPTETIKVVTITDAPKSMTPGSKVEVKTTKGTPVPSVFGGCLRPEVKLEEVYTPPPLKRRKGFFGEKWDGLKPRKTDKKLDAAYKLVMIEDKTEEPLTSRKQHHQQVLKGESGKKDGFVERARALIVPLVQTRSVVAYQTYKDVWETVRSEKKVQSFGKPKTPTARESSTRTQAVESLVAKPALLLEAGQSPLTIFTTTTTNIPYIFLVHSDILSTLQSHLHDLFIMLMDTLGPFSTYLHQKGLKMKKVVKEWKDEVFATLSNHNASTAFSSAASAFGCSVWNWMDAAFLKTARHPEFQQAQVKFEAFREEAKRRYSAFQEHATASSKGVIVRAQQTSLIVRDNLKLASVSLLNSAKGVRASVESRFVEGMMKKAKSLDLWKDFAISLKEQATSSSKDLMALATSAQQQTSLIVRDNFKKASESFLSSATAMGGKKIDESGFADKMVKKKKAGSLDVWKAFVAKKYEEYGRCMLEKMGGDLLVPTVFV
ncbi:hypothetical protein HDV05_004641 [Chytridiales sp. JEL 0842]|nr:hypothetical protein HDV05_004641 [Chytridiales sp. JEL 0842]